MYKCQVCKKEVFLNFEYLNLDIPVNENCYKFEVCSDKCLLDFLDCTDRDFTEDMAELINDKYTDKYKCNICGKISFYNGMWNYKKLTVPKECINGHVCSFYCMEVEAENRKIVEARYKNSKNNTNETYEERWDREHPNKSYRAS